jgi:hypothetical protein
MLSTMLQILSRLKWPVKFLLKTFRNAWTNAYIYLGLFFELTKAYDVINHEILFNKLEYYGIRGTIKTGIETYLLYQL